MRREPQILIELALAFLRLGATAFGGPAAHIGIMQQEFVTRRKWLDAQEFLDLVGATNLIPGPNSTEVAIHIGFKRAGLAGLVVAGVCFIAPAMLMVLMLAALYTRHQSLPEMRWLLTGVQPVVIAIIAHALGKLARTAIKNRFTFVVAMAAIALVVCGLNEVAVIFLAALTGLLAGAGKRQREYSLSEQDAENEPKKTGAALFIFAGATPLAMPMLAKLFLIFLKIGSLVYGSGYVLIAFLRDDFVAKTGWITDRQLLDAIAVGQLTPGPLFTSATFIGYLIGHVPGALVATLGIFLPSFFFVALLARSLEKMRRSPRARLFLDALNAASIALMAVVTIQLLAASIDDAGPFFPLALGIFSLLLLSATKINSLWLLATGALLGFVFRP